MIYEDFLCPGCGQLEAQSNERARRSWPMTARSTSTTGRSTCSTGWATTPHAPPARSASCSTSPGPEVAKEFHDLLYADQPEEGDEPYPDADWLVEKAVEAGADEADVRPGIEEGETDFAKEATEEAEDAGVHRHPDRHPRRRRRSTATVDELPGLELASDAIVCQSLG